MKYNIYYVPDLSALAMPAINIEINHSNEYWYIGSIIAKSATQKNNICVFLDTGIYKDLVSSISASVVSAIATLIYFIRIGNQIYIL